VKRTVHIRRRQTRINKTRWLQGGGPPAMTMCGAEPTCYDAGWRDTVRRWISPQTGILYYPCEPCVRLREEAR